MADIIDLTERFRSTENLITPAPLELRRGDWQSGYAIMCTREESRLFEVHRCEALKSPGHQHLSKVPNHFTLDGGYHYTFMGLLRYRAEEAAMRRVYRLAGWMQCVTSASSQVLRTDLLRRFYKSILEEREELKVAWRGNIRHFLLPLHPAYHNPNLLLQKIMHAETLKELYDVIENETDEQFEVLKRFYVFYLPENMISSQRIR